MHALTVHIRWHERGLRFMRGDFVGILEPGRHRLWRRLLGTDRDRAEVQNTLQGRLTHPLLEVICRHPSADAHLVTVNLAQRERALVFRAGRLEAVLDVSGQEIMTADKVSLRVNLLVTYRVIDPVRAVSQSVDASAALYRTAQLALRAAIGTRTLDALLTQKAAAGDDLRQEIEAGATALGLEVRSVGLRDIILPGEMKAILSGAQSTFVFGAKDLPEQLRSLVAPP